MYCPNPECPFFLETGTPAEHRPEFLKCSDCGTALQPEKPSLRRRSEPMEDLARGPVYIEGNELDRDRLVTVATYGLPEPAHHARGILESVGVTAFVGDDHVVGMAPYLAGVAGGIKLNVPAEQVEQAIALLEEYHLVEGDGVSGEDSSRAAASGEDDEDAETDDAFFVNAVFALIKWGGYAVVIAIIVMAVLSALRS